ncbi:MAG TPA: single-stranded DNA-binding protein [Candidatus Nanoarchaeia archaeon]|nr:single-stranded DNA-binding protein [Candidatus Nanoarchaeia archaeon]
MPNLKFPEINQVAISGRLCQDPELRVMESGKTKVTFHIAANQLYRDDKGEWQKDTTFIPISAWDKLAEYAAERLKKCSAVFLTGRLKSRTIETSNNNCTILEVVARHIQFLDKKKESLEAEAQPEEESTPF